MLCAWAALPGAGSLRAAEERSTSFTANAPVINFRVSTFTRDGFRSWLLCGAEGTYVNDTQLDVVDLNLTVFAGNASNKVESVFLSPSAVALIGAGRVRGPKELRLITDDFEATGEDWLYDHRQKKVSIHRDVRVVFHARLNDILR
jgi:hypothetical protein